MPRKKVLFVGEGVTLAHVVRPSLLADALDYAKFETFFACSTHFHALLCTSKHTLIGIRSTTPSDFLKILQRGDELFSEATVTSYVEEELELFSRLKPDLIVGDLRLSLGVSAPLLGIPYISVSNAYWSPHSARSGLPLPAFPFIHRMRLHKVKTPVISKLINFGFNQFLPLIFAKQADGLDRTRQKFGLQKFENYLTGFTWGNYTCFADSPSVAPVRQLLPHQRYIGPVCWAPGAELPHWWGELKFKRPLVYVSLGSSGPVDLLPLIFEALSKFDIDIILATAERVSSASIPANVFHANYLPADKVLPHADVAITNGGSPSTHQALRHGIPCLGLPLNMDQLLCMSNISDTGCGIMLRADNVVRSEMESALNNLLYSDRYRRRAQIIAEEFSNFDYAKEFNATVSAALGVPGQCATLSEGKQYG